jgi:hypothetical protein
MASRTALRSAPASDTPSLLTSTTSIGPSATMGRGRLMTASAAASSVRSTDHVHELGNLASLLGSAAGEDRLLDAMAHVIAQNFLFRTPQRGTYCRDLGDDIDAISILFEHPGQATDLAFDPVEPSEAGRLDILAHA